MDPMGKKHQMAFASWDLQPSASILLQADDLLIQATLRPFVALGQVIGISPWGAVTHSEKCRETPAIHLRLCPNTFY